MAAETLNFGPEWLRALSSGGSVASPPPSPAMPKYKLADYRYGREEMLALYVKENKVPDELQDKEFAAVLQEEPLQPLALEPLTEEEQRNFSLSVNSVAVLRLMGKGAGPPPGGASRGRGSTRSRGRGRGDSCFYQRSIEEGEGAFGRNPREIQRSQSWDDRGERRFEKSARRDGARSGFEDGGAGLRKEHARSDSENWRSLREEQEEEEEGSWRLGAGPRRDGDRWRSASPDGGPRSAGWREHGDRRRKFEFDLRGDRGGCGEEEGRVGGGSSHLRRCRGPDGFDDDKDGLPEWCLDDEDEEMGTFDASGAFLPLKKGPKEPIPEEQELDFQGLEEEEEEPSEGLDEEGPEAGGKELTPLPPPEEKSSSPSPLATLGPLWGANGDGGDAVEKDLPAAEGDDLRGMQLSPGMGSPPGPPGDLEDDEGLKHLQQEAEKLVASLQDSSLEEEQFTAAMQAQGLRHSAAATALPLSHGAARKWFYKDPQGEIQGPFTTQEMAEWFQAGYFSMALLVKRGCDEGFQPLGEVIKMWGRVPFAPGPSPPPLLVSIPTFARSREGRWELDGGQRGVWSTRSKRWECFRPHSGQHGPGAAEEATGAGSSGLVPAAAAPAISSTGQQPLPPAVWAPGKGGSGGPDATAAAAAHRLPAAAPSSQTPQRWGPEPAPDDEPFLVGAGFRLPLGHTYLSLITVRR